MKIKILLILAVVVITLGTVFFFRGSNTKTSITHDSTNLIVGRNAIYVDEQSLSRTVSVAVVRLEKTGFVVIHEDNAGKPGKILGASNALPTGETKNLTPIALSRTTLDGETLYAMLHLDDGDGTFDATKDKPAQDSVDGSPVMMIFSTSLDGSVPGIINL